MTLQALLGAGLLESISDDHETVGTVGVRLLTPTGVSEAFAMTRRKRPILWLYSKALPGFWSLFFVALLVFNARQYGLAPHSWSTSFEHFVLPTLLAGLFFSVVRASLDTRLTVANSLVTLMVALYAGEFFLAHRLEAAQRSVAATSGTSFDNRDKRTVIRDLRGEGVEAYPVMRGENLLVADGEGALRSALSAKGHPFLPLASIPHTTVVSCNESGQWQIYETDRHGFHNPDSEWDARPAIGMVGDSFTHGSCVPEGEDMGALLRSRFNGVINLGVGGFGPLLELAALTEYLRPLQPPVVLWGFFEGNDLTEDLPSESHSPLLDTYLRDESFSQGLIGRREEVEAALRDYLDGQMTTAMSLVYNPYEGPARYLSLDRMREAVGLGHLAIGYHIGEVGSEVTLFRKILRAADHRVGAWGGRLYLVYLPESARYLSQFGDNPIREAIYKGVRRTAAQEHVPLIDLAAAFASDPSPETLYAYPGGHCSPKGYQLAAETISRELASTVAWLPTPRTRVANESPSVR